MEQRGLLFPKPTEKRKRKKQHPKSIIHQKSSRTCYLCIMLHDNWSEYSVLHEHHIFGGPNRTHSEEYGLKVYLCLQHHMYGPEAVHNNDNIMQQLHEIGQQVFEESYPEKDFREIFGKNFV